MVPFWHIGWSCTAAALLLMACLPLGTAFIEELFGQAFGGGGSQGGFQFQMGDGGMFEMGGGGGRRPKAPKWPKGVPDKVSKKMSWLKGTEWNWNNWRHVKLQKDGTFDAPTRDCQSGTCKWSANKNKVYVLWGEAGVHELDVIGEPPSEPTLQKMAGLVLRGRRLSDGEACTATFQRIFDYEAAELEKDLYEILGLQDDADEAEIKKVYRKLSIKYHPDKNPDEESRKKFADIRDAYEILNDPDKKILYDTGGMEAVKNAEKGQVQKGDDVQVRIDVGLQDLYNGGVTKANLERRIVCRGCRVRPDSQKCQSCTRCPNEYKMVHQQVGPGMFIQQQQEVPSKEKCKHENTIIDVQIEKGMRIGESVTFERMGEQRPGMLPGSVIFQLHGGKHPKFTRAGDNLHMQVQVSLREALLGWTRTVRHMDGHLVKFGTSGSVTKPMQLIQVKGEGMPLRDDPASFGDLFVRVEVIFPKTLTSSQQELVGQLFVPDPPRAEL